jgi:hypothetical protein
MRYFFPDNHSFAILDKERVVGIHPLYIARLGLGQWTELLLHSGLHRHTGLAMAEGLDPGTVKAVRAAAMRRIEEVAEGSDADRIQLNSQNLAPQNLSSLRGEIPFWVTDYGYFLGMGIGSNGLAPAPALATCCADQIIKLDDTENTLFARLDEGCRRAVRKAQSAGLEWGEGGERCIPDYYALAEMSARRTGETLAARAYYEDVGSAFWAAGYCKVLFAYSGSRKVAALMLLVYKGAAHFLGGVSNPEYLPARVNDFIHWSAIIWSKHQGLSFYRLGPVFPELPDDWPVVRVSKFKGKFGGRSYSIIQGSRFRYPNKYLELGVAHLSHLISGSEKNI